MNNILDEIKELKEKAVKYDNLRSRNINYISKINKIIEELEDLKKQIDPFGSGQERERKDLFDVKKQIFETLESGGEYTVEKICNDFQVTDKSAYHIIRELLKNKNVARRSEGRKVIIYAQKVV